MAYTKQEVSKLLTEGKYQVVFTKSDGSERVMKCTLLADVLEPYIKAAEEHKKQLLAEGKEVKEKPENPDVLAVIDLENNGWRSFRLDSIKEITELKD